MPANTITTIPDTLVKKSRLIEELMYLTDDVFKEDSSISESQRCNILPKDLEMIAVGEPRILEDDEDKLFCDEVISRLIANVLGRGEGGACLVGKPIIKPTDRFLPYATVRPYSKVPNYRDFELFLIHSPNDRNLFQGEEDYADARKWALGKVPDPRRMPKVSTIRTLSNTENPDHRGNSFAAHKPGIALSRESISAGGYSLLRAPIFHDPVNCEKQLAVVAIPTGVSMVFQFAMAEVSLYRDRVVVDNIVRSVAKII